jgi:trehalose 2-sulfotransferase
LSSDDSIQEPVIRQSYVICSTPRSGSYLLCGALAATGVAGIPTERFPKPPEFEVTPQHMEEWTTRWSSDLASDPSEDAAYVRAILRQGTTRNGVFGIKIHRVQLDDAIKRIGAYLGRDDLPITDLLESVFPNLSYIWLRRRDKIAQAVSLFRASSSMSFVKTNDQRPTTGKKIDYDETKIAFYLSAIRQWDNGWRYFFESNGIQPLILEYEDLASSYVETVKSVLGFLTIPGADGISIDKPRHQRMSDEVSASWIARFKESRNKDSRVALPNSTRM